MKINALRTIFFLSCLLGGMVFAQNASFTAVIDESAKSLEDQKTEGVFAISLNANEVTKAIADQKATYYSQWFAASVVEDNGTLKTTVTLTANEIANRNILKRYCLNIGVSKINFRGTDYDRDDFFDQYLLN